MPFIAVIDRPRNLATWCRSCVSLAGIAAQIQFLLGESSLAIEAINSSRTTHAEVLFERSFFRDLTLEKGNSADIRSPIVVSSKHLMMLFKNLDPHGLNYICLRVESSIDIPIQRQFKLNVEMSSKKLVLKKYQISFQPVLSEVASNLDRYNQTLHHCQSNRFALQTSIMKLFLDMVPALTEDFGIDIKLNKICFTAYTKQVMKDRDYLKHPMLIVILMATEELPDSTLGDVKTNLNFRLKDFRNFINLVSNLKAEASHDLDPIEPEPTFEAIFKEPASPILLQHIRSNFAVRFLQITADDADAKTSDNLSTFVLNIPKLQQQAIQDANVTSKADSDDSLATSKRRRVKSTHGSTYSNSLLLDDEETDYSTSEDENVTVLGPTQNVGKPASLFD